MTRATLRRIGGLLLFVTWVPVATANALPCAVFCMLEATLAHAQGMGDNDPMMAHHMQETKMASSGHCETPHLLIVACIPPELLTPPSIDAAVTDIYVRAVFPTPSATPEFGTPPPRA